MWSPSGLLVKPRTRERGDERVRDDVYRDRRCRVFPVRTEDFLGSWIRGRDVSSEPNRLDKRMKLNDLLDKKLDDAQARSEQTDLRW